ncbi:MAG TPA: MFS transporter, partial [Saprospiraceae bacterium]|nr:MFS transporter [Saprospiraceae bacterium]
TGVKKYRDEHLGGMIGLERTVLPLFAEQKFHLASALTLLSFIAAFGAAKAAANYLTGYLSDRVGRKALLVAGWVLALPVPYLLYAAPQWAWVVGAHVLLGMHQGLAWSSTVVMKIDLVGERQRGLAMGLNEFAGYVALALTAWGSAQVAHQVGAEHVLLYGGWGVAGIGLALSVFGVRDTHAHVALEAARSCRKQMTQVFRQVTWRHPNLSSITHAGWANNLNDGMVWGMLPLLLQRQGYSLVQIGWVTGLYPLVWGVAQVFSGQWSDRVSKRQMLALGMLLQACALLGLLWADGLAAYLCVSALLGLGTALVYPVFMAAIADNVHPLQRAESIGVFRLWRDLGYVFGAVLTGLLMDWAGIGAAIETVAFLTAASAAQILYRMTDVPPCDAPPPASLCRLLKNLLTPAGKGR